MFLSKPLLGKKCDQSNELVFKVYASIGKPAIISANKELKESKHAEQTSEGKALPEFLYHRHLCDSPRT